MKKALALVLALVLALSMAVSAFAVEVIELDKVSTLTKDNRVALEQLEIYDGESGAALNAKKPTYKVGPDGGEFYFFLQNGKDYSANLKDFEVTANGAVVSAEMIDFDGDTMKTPAGVVYVVTNGTEFWDAVFTPVPSAEWQKDYDAQYKKSEKLFEAPEYKGGVYGPNDYEYAVALAEYLNDGAEVLGKYAAVPAYYDNGWHKANLYVLKLTVSENYSAAYDEGDFKVTAYNKDTKKEVAYAADIISDVTIFEYEQVKYAAKEEAALKVGAKGYSDFETALNGYGKDYVVNKLREIEGATVVSTTAFRAIEGKDLYVAADKNVLVTIEEVAAAQKGVNFDFYSFIELDEDRVPCYISKKPIDALAFGFYGEQAIRSDFSIEVNLGMTAYELRELFGLKVEEEDIIPYYVVNQDNEVVTTIKVDYMTANLVDDIEFTITGNAGDILGEYEIVLDVPAAEVEGEENPNTGAESVVGVVAALAVVSVATAAAVSLKK